jgi:Protein of unknown function (DUF4236)
MRTTLTSHGVGWSIGVPGFRYGISASGRRYISIGIPGTGIYGIHYFTSGKRFKAFQANVLKKQPNAALPPIIPSAVVRSSQPTNKWWHQQ